MSFIDNTVPDSNDDDYQPKHEVEQPTETPNVVIPNANARKVLYTVVGFVALALACTNAGFGFALTAEAVEEFPLWLGITNAVFPIFGAGIGYTASRNTPR